MSSAENPDLEVAFMCEFLRNGRLCHTCAQIIIGRYLEVTYNRLVLEPRGSEDPILSSLERFVEIKSQIIIGMGTAPLDGPFLRKLEDPSWFDVLLGKWEAALGEDWEDSIYELSHAGLREIRSKLRYACSESFSLIDLFAGRRIQGFVHMHTTKLIDSLEPIRGSACTCPGDMHPKIAEALGDIPMPVTLSSDNIGVGSKNAPLLVAKLCEVERVLCRAMRAHLAKPEVQEKLAALVPLGNQEAAVYQAQLLNKVGVPPPPYRAQPEELLPPPYTPRA